MNAEFWLPVKLSIQVATVSGIIVIILGTIFARMIARRQFKGKILVETTFLLPLVLPPSVVGFLLIVIFGRNSPVGQGIEWFFGQPIMFTLWAAILASTVVSFPLMYQSAKAGFESVDVDIEGAAKVDGANEMRVFLYVTLPLAVKSIATGAILSFARGLGEFGATLMFAGNIPGKTQTLPTAIYVAIDSGNMDMAWMWVAMMIALSFLMLGLVNLMKA